MSHQGSFLISPSSYLPTSLLSLLITSPILRCQHPSQQHAFPLPLTPLPLLLAISHHHPVTSRLFSFALAPIHALALPACRGERSRHLQEAKRSLRRQTQVASLDIWSGGRRRANNVSFTSFTLLVALTTFGIREIPVGAEGHMEGGKDGRRKSGKREGENKKR